MAVRRKKNINIGKSLDIPSGITSGFFVEIHSGKEAVLTGKCDVLKLEDTVLKIKCCEHEVTFLGSRLRIESYTADEITISGDINNVEFD